MLLEREFNYYINHQGELVSKYDGKFLVIKNDEVIGVYDSESDAYNETEKKEELGTFLIQHCTPGEESYTQAFRSRVSFA